MKPTEFFSSITILSSILSELQEAGMRVEIGSDFSKYRNLRASQTSRSAIFPMFDTSSSYVDESNGFWVCGFDSEGSLIHTQAVRLLELHSVTLGEHLRMHRHKYITPDTTPDPDATFYVGPKALAKITGRVAYHGEFWLPGAGLGGPRSQGATVLLSRVLLETVVRCWNPDFMFALVPQRLASKGAHLRYGYSHCEPGQWYGPDGQVTDEDFLIWMSASDLRYALSQRLHAMQGGHLSSMRSVVCSIDSKG
jgi:hypothetical protein